MFIPKIPKTVIIIVITAIADAATEYVKHLK